MANESYFRFDDDNDIKYTYSHNHQQKCVSCKHTAPYIAGTMMERTDLILDIRHTRQNAYDKHLYVQCF